jgi:serine/threonine-protein kinase
MPTLRESIEAKYEILERIGQGGMGAVYKARHRLLDQLRAIKVIRSPVEPSPEAGERFLREARAASRLRHPNLAVLHDFDMADDGNAWLVLEWIEGLTLRQALRRHGPPPLPLALEIARQACEALGHLHHKRIVHRDISPGNLMLARDDRDGGPLVKLIDLGLAKALEGAGESVTTGGLFLGKLRYASPEQFGADPVDERSDLYSLGTVLYEMLTGRTPVEGHDAMSWMAGHLARPPVPFEVSDPQGRIPDDLRGIVLQALAKRPEDRFDSTQEMAEALRAVQALHPLRGDEMDGVFGTAPAMADTVEPAEPTEEEEASLSLPLFAATATNEPFDALPLQPTPGPAYDPPAAPAREGLIWDADEPMEAEPELLGPARRPDGSWGTLAAAAVLTVALLGAFLWFHRSGAPQFDPPPYAPPPSVDQPAASPSETPSADIADIAEPDAPLPPEPEIVEEQTPETEELPAEPEEPIIEMAPGPARAAPPVQTADVTPPKPVKPERPRSQEPARIATVATHAAVAAPKRVPFGPPADRMAGVLRPGPGVEMPVPFDLPQVRYPEAARGSGLQVDVHLDLLVDEQGKVVDALVREGDPANFGFNQAAVQAALGTRFQPATRWDVPGKAWTELILEFDEPRLEPERGR